MASTSSNGPSRRTSTGARTPGRPLSPSRSSGRKAFTAEGEEPSTLFAEAITKIVTPDNVYSLPAQSTTK